MACRKPDCVPLETVMMLLGHGWHEKAEIYNAAEAVTESEVTAVARSLWRQASEKYCTQSPPRGTNVDNISSAAVTQTTSVSEIGTVRVKTGSVNGFSARDTNSLSAGDDPVGSGGLPVVLPRDVEGYYEDSEEVYAVGTNGRKCTLVAGLDHLGSSLKELVLRSHVITRMEGIGSLVNLTKLEFYDNQIEALEQLESLPQLTILDMSYNSIRSMAPVANCVKLQEIYLAQNKLRQIEGLKGLCCLKKLDVGGNRIRSLEGLLANVSTPSVDEAAAISSKIGNDDDDDDIVKVGIDTTPNTPFLEELWCGKNKIEEVGYCLKGLGNLKRLDIQCNRLTHIYGGCLSGLSQLEELYLARNGFSGTIGSDALVGLSCLTTLDLSNNRLTSTEHITGGAHCPLLEEAWLGGNCIPSLEAAVVGLKSTLPCLGCVYLEHNPLISCCKAEGFTDGEAAYRYRLKQLLPTLKQIDATPVLDHL